MRSLLMINPQSDAAFAAAAHKALDGRDTPAALADALRSEYPAVMVRARALSGESIVVWYVYRDGRWMGEPKGASGDVGDR